MNEPPPPTGPPPETGPPAESGPPPETVDVVGVALRLVNIADEHEYVEVCAWCRRGFVDDAPAYRHDDTYSVVHLHPACVDAADRQARVIAHLRALRPMIDAFTGADYALTVSRLWSTARDPALPRVRDGHAVAVAQRVAELLPLLEHAYAVDIDDGVT